MAGQPLLSKQEHFLIIEDDKGRQQILLRKSTYTIGRSPECDIRLRSQFVSRYHAMLYRKEDSQGVSYYQIVDGDSHRKPSANGLLINGVKEPCHDLKHGDEVVFGPQVFAIYQYRQFDHPPTMPTNDPFDITLIDPSMMEYGDDTIEYE
ncbi:FHA domain containing protein [Rippkaea orientalis PCC 8801]|uniref:FHA domain containing protein n=1 Tax=Rippkaea orientalis (strain PCC 8801 / RF-1) TaxID=41431 RepID=B7JUR0_RIPO1|nr:FHA domain-containing protein [Rippkaea orientalis]ACK65604.1 FHA domain containing protein [Rippkaea orientalis PCC 8801]